MLCENALALAAECSTRGMDVSVGYAGSLPGEEPLEPGLSAGELAVLLAFPASLPLEGPENLPLPADNRGILVLALPRTEAPATCLDRFLKSRGDKQPVDILFLFQESLRGKKKLTQEEYAGICERLYNQRGGVYARSVRL
jgi:hypothetical protein